MAQIESTSHDVPPVPPPVAASTDPKATEDHEGGQQAPSSSPSSPAPTAASAVEPPPQVPLDRYTFEKIPIVLVAQFRPVKQEGQPRTVWLSVQNGVHNEQDSPLYLVTDEAEIGPWPEVVTRLLKALRDDLPERQRRFEAKRVAAPAVSSSTSASATTTAPALSHKKPIPKATEKATAVQPPPVPTASNPIPKKDLSMSGLFDGLDE